MNGNKPKLAELHAHLGASVQPHIMWSIAHEQGIKLPTKDYWEFKNLLTVNEKGRLKDVDKLNDNLYHLSELIQSSPLAVEPIVHHTITGAYRNSNIVHHELRFNPAKRNRGGERDLDYIILAAIRGMEKAILEFPQVKVGIILMLDREFDLKLNQIIYEKAQKYQNRGIIGIDLAGPQRKNFKLNDLASIYIDAKKNGFGTTAHTGEEGDLQEMRNFVKQVKPHRIGHGILAWQDKELMDQLVENNIYLEICPTSNLLVGIIKNYREMKKIYNTLYKAGVKLTINTDGPEFYNTNLQKELDSLIVNEIFDQKQIDEFIANGFKASFIK
ncbi:MAG: adenosine deaminase [Candidatus Kuenenbacteria bacterium]